MSPFQPFSQPIRLGVNIDHVATIRNARGGVFPDPVHAAHMAIAAGADSITAHLREDRRHITDRDVERLKAEILTPLNFEMAATQEMLDIACRIRPHAACLVPEKREERTTEGGLNVSSAGQLYPIIDHLKNHGIRVSLFIEPDPYALDHSKALGVPVVELHTGSWCEAVLKEDQDRIQHEWTRLEVALQHGAALGLEIHAGHGLTYDTAEQIASLPHIVELNIGHFLIGESIFRGLDEAVRLMDEAMERGLKKRFS